VILSFRLRSKDYLTCLMVTAAASGIAQKALWPCLFTTLYSMISYLVRLFCTGPEFLRSNLIIFRLFRRFAAI
jgi:hypothetical protein